MGHIVWMAHVLWGMWGRVAVVPAEQLARGARCMPHVEAPCRVPPPDGHSAQRRLVPAFIRSSQWPGTCVLTLCLALPVICRYLQDSEPFDRGFYAGPFGWVSGQGAEFVVAIRSAMVPTDAAAITAGQPSAAAAGGVEQLSDAQQHKVGTLPGGGACHRACQPSLSGDADIAES